MNLYIYREPLNFNYLFFIHKDFWLFKICCIIFFFYFFYKIYNAAIFLLKINFLKIHYFLINFDNFKFNKIYCDFIYFLMNWSFMLCQNILYFSKYFFDFIYFNKIMIITYLVLPYYGLYKFFFNLCYFFLFKLEYLCDFFVSELLYSKQNFLDAKYSHEYKLYNPIVNGFYSNFRKSEVDNENFVFMVEKLNFYIFNKLLLKYLDSDLIFLSLKKFG